MDFDFTQHMQNATDKELIKITTTERESYQETAVLAAENELKKRNLSTETITEATALNEAESLEKKRKANLPLDLHWKLLTFMLPGLIQIMLSGLFKSEGYDRKCNDLVKWTLYGFGFYIILMIFLSLI